MKHFFPLGLIAAILFANLSWSSTEVAPSSAPLTLSKAPCIDCHPSDKDKSDFESLLIFGKQLDKNLSCDKTSDQGCLVIKWLQQKHQTYAKNCQGFFVDQTGGLGELSRSIARHILEDLQENRESSVFYVDNLDFQKLCPGFKDMNAMQKLAFHTWIFELTAFPESTCSVGVPANRSAQVPNGPAVCMYQLELSPELRKWRSAGFKQKHCGVSEKEILSLEGCTGCAFDEYKRHIVANGRPFGTLTADGSQRVNRSYWASQNPLTKQNLDCMKANSGLDAKKHPLWLSKCKGAIAEWEAPIKFFGRIGRFPLCKTDQAKKELESLKD